ncbi:uncharacterized protein LOC108910056 [Anoplophora glabripennis]|uniref:uncharacterized protein LOC108910056 n=1 Tax=Anoplophora glabripennis TaxID=217634 RepID=UPI000873CA43|nr:uncharacterized protein LOC108910056 [Anoplophora glabripennis]
MAKLQIFVFIVALSQVYGSIEITNFPALLPIEDIDVVDPKDFPTVPVIVTPPCVASIRALLEAILERLPEIEQPRPLPVDPVEPVVPEVEAEPEDSPVVETPCSACFEHINSLLTSAEKVIAVRRMALSLYRRR